MDDKRDERLLVSVPGVEGPVTMTAAELGEYTAACHHYQELQEQERSNMDDTARVRTQIAQAHLAKRVDDVVALREQLVKLEGALSVLKDSRRRAQRRIRMYTLGDRRPIGYAREVFRCDECGLVHRARSSKDAHATGWRKGYQRVGKTGVRVQIERCPACAAKRKARLHGDTLKRHGEPDGR